MKRYLFVTLTALVSVLLMGLWLHFSVAEIADQPVEGGILRSEHWSGTIRIVGDTWAMPWVTLTIAPGTRILFEKLADVPNTPWTEYADAYIKDHSDPTGHEGYQQSHFELLGKIIARGTATQPIIFTSAAAKPEYADWDQLILLRGSLLEYVDMLYAHNGINVEGDGVTIRNSKVHDSLWSCIDIFSRNNIIEYNEIYHCWHQGIGFKAQGDNIVRGNNIHDAQLSVNCENGALPTIANNFFKAAPLSPDCGRGIENEIINADSDTDGGTYGGKLIYPSRNFQ